MMNSAFVNSMQSPDPGSIPQRLPGSSVPLSFGQRQIWLIQELAPDTPAYNVPIALWLDIRVDIPALQLAVNTVVRRHEVLRTSFRVLDGQPIQTIAEACEVPLERADLTSISLEQCEDALRRRLVEEARQPFHLNSLPLLRLVVFDLGSRGEVLLIVTHHIIWDGWSQAVFLGELECLYSGFANGEDPDLPPLPVQYGDFSAWQHERSKNREFEADQAYWELQLTGAQPQLDLPADFARPVLPAFSGASLWFEIEESVTTALQEVARAAGATLYMTLLAAYALFLTRYNRQQRIQIGSPIANRGLEELHGLIGYFANVLVMRLEPERSLTFTEFLKRVKATALDAYEHQDLPFESLVDKLRPERTLNSTPLIQTLFVMQDGSAGNPRGKLSGRSIALDIGVAKFDLSLSVRARAGSLSAELNYDTSLFSPGTAELFRDSLLLLLQTIAARPSEKLGELINVTSPAERRVIGESNATGTSLGSQECLHVLFEQQVLLSSSKPAVICENQTVSFGELNQRANQLAHYLQSRGAGPETCVGVCMERSIEMVVSLIAILKTGAAYLPLDPEYPDERLQWMQCDARPQLVLAQQRFANKLNAAAGSQLLVLESAWHEIIAQPKGVCAVSVRGENVAYVIYTSGSSGRPKGVMNRHRGICNRLLWMQQQYGLSEADRVLQKTPYSFDVSVWEFFWPLITGACLVMAKPGGHRDNSYLQRVIREYSVTTIHFVPSMLHSMLHSGALRDCTSLTRVISSGEALSPALVKRFYQQCDAGLHNLYGPTEASVDVTSWMCERQKQRCTTPVGFPIANTRIYILDTHLNQVPLRVPAELYIAGEGLARGYWNRPDLTAEKFIPDPFDGAGGRLYRTGDLARYANDGAVEYLGRLDGQVKVRGNRIELAEVEEVLKQHDNVHNAAVVLRNHGDEEKRLVAFVVAKQASEVDSQALRVFLRRRLPEYMTPARFVFLPALPLNQSGKVDRTALPADDMPSDTKTDKHLQTYVAPRDVIEKRIAAIWASVLQLERVGVNDNFFDLGGHSLALVSVHSELRRSLKIEIPVLDLFRFPTVASLAGHLASHKKVSRGLVRPRLRSDNGSAIAIIAMAGRFPGARSIEQFWDNLKNGVESISFFSDGELADIPESIRRDPHYVRASAVLEDSDYFDAEFFGFRPREAETTDPQQRVFLECAWEVLERAGYDSERYDAPIGVFAGAGASGYWFQLAGNQEITQTVSKFQLNIGNDKDHLPLRVSYKLNLKGPSVSVQTACSTSLVAVHMACQNLLCGESSMAIAGGVSIRAFQRSGYLHEEGGITSPDGHCRAFDADAAGTVSGNGAGVVLLKRLTDALEAGDHIHAVILGSAINNDGAAKVGYTAPGIDGQAAVIAQAHANAGVPADTITYVEAHGTATSLGDPAEVAALTQAFRLQTNRTQFCALGSVKTNVGHLDAAAGVTGLIKATLALEHGIIPASLHFKRPNPQIDFAATPFYVNSQLNPWKTESGPRRAGVSSFGIGGANAHLVLEEPPEQSRELTEVDAQLLILSCKKESALVNAAMQLADHLEENTAQRVADVAFTLQEGRRELGFRKAVACHGRKNAIHSLRSGDARQVSVGGADRGSSPLYFLFPGQGVNCVNWMRGLFASSAIFRKHLEHCAEIAQPLAGYSLLELVYPRDPSAAERSQQELRQTSRLQLILFVIEYSLASFWMDLGVIPDGLLGHSVGEYMAACLAGVMSLEDAISVVALRARGMQSMPPGGMISILASYERLQSLLDQVAGISLAAVNGPSLFVLSGAEEAMVELENYLAAHGMQGRRLNTSHAFHSPLMGPVAEPLRHLLKQIKLRPPAIPVMSNLTGTWLTSKQAMNPDYWIDHLLGPVQFSENLSQLLRAPQSTMLEMGPETLLVLAKRHERPVQTKLLPSIQADLDPAAEYLSFLHAVAELWVEGRQIKWSVLRQSQKYRRIVLPTYPFERHRYRMPVVVQDTANSSAANNPRERALVAPKSVAKHNGTQRLILEQLEAVAEQLDLLSHRVQ